MVEKGLTKRDLEQIFKGFEKRLVMPSFLSALVRKVEEGFFTLFGPKEQSIFVPAIVSNDHHSCMLWCFGFFQ